MPFVDTLLPDMIEDFVAPPGIAVLVLTKRHCAACAAWTEEIDALPADAPPWAGVRFAKLILDQPGLAAFKRFSPWLREVTDLPYNVIYVDGEVAARFLGGGTGRLAARLARLGGEATAPPPAIS